MAQRSLIRISALLFLLGISFVNNAGAGQAAVLKDLHIGHPVEGDVVVFGADLYLEPGTRIEGDAVAIGGDVIVSRDVEVDGHVVAVLGHVEVSRDATVGGRVLGYSSLASLGGASPVSGDPRQVDFSMRLLTAGGWLLVTTGLAFLFPVRIRFGAWAVPTFGFKILALGLLLGLTVVASVVAALGFGPALGVPLVASLMIIFFAAKAVGLTVLGCWLGGAVLERWFHHPMPISLEVFVGLLILLALRFTPVVGENLWTVISLTALGAAIAVAGISTDSARAAV